MCDTWKEICKSITLSRLRTFVLSLWFCRLLGKVACTSYVWSSKMTTHQAHQNVNSSLHCFIQTFTHPALSVCRFWTKRKIGDQLSQSSKSFLVFRICWTNQMWKIQLKPKHTQYIGITYETCSNCKCYRYLKTKFVHFYFAAKIVWNMRSASKLKPEQWLHKNKPYDHQIDIYKICGKDILCG